MTIFDLVFLASFLVSVAALFAAAWAAVRSRLPRAFTILGVWTACAIVYLGISAGVAYAAPQRVIPMGTPWCFDDWCLTVTRVLHADTNYAVDLLISSTAKRVTQRANGAWIYLRDENDRHYEPFEDPGQIPLDVLLQPGDSIEAQRRFHVPAKVHELGVVTGHGGVGPPCGLMSLLIIGQAGCLFHKETMIRLPLEY